jgi:hypothetical protein
MKRKFSRQIFDQYSNIKFHENLSSVSTVVSCRRTDRQTDMTKLIVTFRNFPNAPKNLSQSNFAHYKYLGVGSRIELRLPHWEAD